MSEADAIHAVRRRGRPPSGGREAILDAALALVREAGIAKLTSREVALRAGVSDASVYYHFKDREGLLLAVFAHGMKPLSFLSELPVELDHATVLARAFAAFEAFFADVLPVMHAAQAEAELARALAVHMEANDHGPHRGVRLLSEYLQSEQAAGRANPAADTEAVALLLIDAAFSRAARREIMRPDEDDERLPAVERLLATLNQLLEPPAA